MSDKKQASVVWIAFVHALFTFIASILLLIILIFLIGALSILFGYDEGDIDALSVSNVGLAAAVALNLLVLWYSTANSAKVVFRRYVDVDKTKLLNTSAMFYAGILLLGVIAELAFFKSLTWDSAAIILDLALFYVITKKYLAG
ncbi:MAG TPA: hypothetical protein VGB97_03680 [Candidatus Paceibacterota bacterium]|jgi:hypothetical protein